MNESERFAAAAIAFTWQHQLQFREHFWNRICSFKGDASLTDRAEIFVEPYRWADLLITNPAPSEAFVYVVELKIHASLEDIQNPAKRQFGLANGYGRLFAANFGFHGEALRFVVLGAKPVRLRPHPWTLPVRVAQRNWRDLAASFPISSICKDLALSLGMLGINAFPAAEVTNMKVDTRQIELAKTLAIIRETERRLWPRNRCKSDVGFEKGDWFIGVELQRTEVEPARSLQKLVQPRWSVGWFGYQGEEGGPPSLAFWFYCGTSEGRRKIASKLRHRLKGCSIDATRPPEYDEFYLVVTARRHAFNNDCEWFCNVFRKLGLPLNE